MTLDYNESQKLNTQPNLLTLFFLEKSDARQPPKDSIIIDLSEEKNYYFSFFEILKKLFPNKNITFFFENFLEQTQGLQNPKSKEQVQKIIFSKKSTFPKYIGSVCFVLGLVGFYVYILLDKTSSISICSDLAIPFEPSFLHRPEFLNQMHKKLNDKNSIQAIALVGPGGAGKTTLAREYVLLHKASIVWEIDAETQESLKNSFENLAQALAKSEEDQKIFRGIQDIKDPKYREEGMLRFVKDHMKVCSSWLLVFDNVETFSDIKKYFPQDVNTWGYGKILLTTQNANIQNNANIDDIILVSKLTSSEKLTLFTKIMGFEKSHSLLQQQEEDSKTFLENIPPYPLDVCVAAYYLRSTNTSYANYLKSLENYNPDFENTQTSLLKESGDYKKTRYKIISHSLKHLMELHKDFTDLLFLISLIDSQSIPRDLLDKFKGSQLVDSFIYNLKKHSLISSNDTSPSIGSSFSMHRSTQAAALAYFVNAFGIEKRNQLIELIANNILYYVSENVEIEDYPKIKLLADICESFLNHENLLSDKVEGLIENELGYVYYHLNDYKKAQFKVGQSLIKLKKYSDEMYINISEALARLGAIYKELGNYKMANCLLEQSLDIYKKHFLLNSAKSAWALERLGNLSCIMGNYKRAQTLLEQSIKIYRIKDPNNFVGITRALESLGTDYLELGDFKQARITLEKSFEIHKKNFFKKQTRVAELLGHLGTTYSELGDFEKAKNLFEKSIANYKLYHLDNTANTARSLAHLGITYSELRDYVKAKSLLEKSFSIYNKSFSDNQADIAWVLAHLGVIYKRMDNYQRAEYLLNKSLRIHRELYGEENIKTIWVLMQLGVMYKDLKHYDKAQVALEKVLNVHKDSFGECNIKLTWVLSALGEVYMGTGNYKKANNLFEKSLAICEKHFGPDHIETGKILENIGEFYLLDGQCFEIAEQFLMRALKIFQKYNGQNRHVLLDKLADKLAKLSPEKFSKQQTRIQGEFK